MSEKYRATRKRVEKRRNQGDIVYRLSRRSNQVNVDEKKVALKTEEDDDSTIASTSEEEQDTHGRHTHAESQGGGQSLRRKLPHLSELFQQQQQQRRMRRKSENEDVKRTLFLRGGTDHTSVFPK